MVKNFMEDIVQQCLDDTLKSDTLFTDICRCERCMDDIKAMALNHIKPFYVTGKKGEVFGQYHTLEPQIKLDIVHEVVSAIDFVAKHKHL